MKTTTVANRSAESVSGAQKYLTFLLGAESYGIPVIAVREIIRYSAPSPLPQLPEHVRGVLNLRGKIVPVVDLRMKFGLAEIRHDSNTCIILAKIMPSSGASTVVGLIVDGVEEVVMLDANQIESAPDFGTKLQTDYILGMATIRNRIKTLLRIDAVVEAGSLLSIADAAGETGAAL